MAPSRGLASVQKLAKKHSRHLDVTLGAVVLYFSYSAPSQSVGGMLPNAGRAQPPAIHPFLAGVLLTGLNARFTAWRLSVGRPMLELLSEQPIVPALVACAPHVWLDFAWLSLLSVAAALIPANAYRAVSLVMGLKAPALALRGLASSLRL